MTDLIISILTILFCIVYLMYQDKLINPILTWNYKSKINGYKTELFTLSPFEIFVAIQLLLDYNNSFFFWIWLIIAIILVPMKLILFGYSLYLALQDDRAGNKITYRMSAYSIIIDEIRSFFEERKKKKHYPYYYVIKYDFFRKAKYYGYDAMIVLEALSNENLKCKENQILKMELKIYGKKYYFKSWDDLLLSIKFNKIWGIKSNENNNQ